MEKTTMLYPELFRSLEQARWSLAADVPWDRFDRSLLSEEQARTIRMNAITEWSALPATEMFLRDNREDADFSAFMSVWFFEEQKHALVLMEYLRRFRPELVPTEEELQEVRFEFDPAPALDTLMLHFCGEVRLTQWYRCAAEWHTEPVIQHVYGLIAADEGRHAGAYLKYMRRAIAAHGDAARLAFARVGVLMASSGMRGGEPLHPTNLHVAKALFPRDTVQSRLPDPDWLERWLTHQIRFDGHREERVIARILKNLSALFGVELATVRDLSRYRRELAGEAARGSDASAPPPAF
ncbi:MAG TPA: ferritin-like domain-containing protein [Anaeromyxobacteraceae bacterium]|nr:ferritin-like domain-containing protein [Anaeromyxobacteraceae bacterium]